MVIVFKAKNVGFYVQFNQSLSTLQVLKILPVTGTVKKWGDEIYFDIGVELPVAHLTTDVSAGDVAYWAEGKSLCVFFGPTPSSVSEKPVPAGPVMLIGKTLASPEELREIKEGEKISAFVFTRTEEPSVCDDRKLTQDEIDVLVKQLLMEKTGKAG